MGDHSQIHDLVSSFYAKAIKSDREKGGAQAACCSMASAGKMIAQLAGYSSADLSALPENLAEESFGCGNPIAFAEVGRGQTVLDLGCGGGLDLMVAAEKVGQTGRVIGVDMTSEMVERARSNARKANLTNIEVTQGQIEDLPVASESVDWVFSNCVINLSPNKPIVFSEIARVLKPGGRMVISDLCTENLPSWMLEYDGLHAACITGAISEEDYVGGLREAGLRSVAVVGRKVYESAEIAMVVEHMLGDGDGRILGGALSANHLARALQGHISSVRFSAAKSA